MEGNEMEMDSIQIHLVWMESGGLNINRNIVTILTMELDILEHSFSSASKQWCACVSLPEVISPLISNIILGTYRPGEFIQYDAGDQWRNNSRKNEGMEPKQKQHPVVDETGDRSTVKSNIAQEPGMLGP